MPCSLQQLSYGLKKHPGGSTSSVSIRIFVKQLLKKGFPFNPNHVADNGDLGQRLRVASCEKWNM